MGSLFLIRHATTAASEHGRNLGQASDPPLAPAGRLLAERLGSAIVAELAELPHDELHLASSSARRCRETIAAVARAVDRPSDEVAVDDGLRELDYGAWEGLTAAECRARDPQLRAAWETDPYATRCPGGESGQDVALRAFPVLERIEAWLSTGRSRCAVVVAHNHVNRLRLCAHLGWPLREYRDRVAQDPGGYSLLTFGAAGRPPVVRRLNAAPA